MQDGEIAEGCSGPPRVDLNQSCEGTLDNKVPYLMGTIWSKIPYDKVARWDSYGTIG